VLAAQVPDLARLLLADDAREVRRAEPAVEAADARAGLAEARVLGRDREIAHHVEHAPAADRMARDQRDHGLGHAADQLLELEHVQASDAVLAHVAVVAAHAPGAARAESAA